MHEAMLCLNINARLQLTVLLQLSIYIIIAESYEEVFNSSDNDYPIFTSSTSSDNEELNYQVFLQLIQLLSCLI